jgi:Ni2+-binding GTPase involved in maturation of urease and hydrogenase
MNRGRRKNITTITVSGPAGTGKSIVLSEIRKMLKEKFNIDVLPNKHLDVEAEQLKDKDLKKYRLRGKWDLQEEHTRSTPDTNDAGEKLKMGIYQIESTGKSFF